MISIKAVQKAVNNFVTNLREEGCTVDDSNVQLDDIQNDLQVDRDGGMQGSLTELLHDIYDNVGDGEFYGIVITE